MLCYRQPWLRCRQMPKKGMEAHQAAMLAMHTKARKRMEVYVEGLLNRALRHRILQDQGLLRGYSPGIARGRREVPRLVIR